MIHEMVLQNHTGLHNAVICRCTCLFKYNGSCPPTGTRRTKRRTKNERRTGIARGKRSEAETKENDPPARRAKTRRRTTTVNLTARKEMSRCATTDFLSLTHLILTSVKCLSK